MESSFLTQPLSCRTLVSSFTRLNPNSKIQSLLLFLPGLPSRVQENQSIFCNKSPEERRGFDG